MVEEYLNEVEKLKDLGRQWNMSEKEIYSLLKDSIDFLEEKESRNKNGPSFKLTCSFIQDVYLLIIFICTTASFIYSLPRKTIHNFAERNVQEIIHPGMKIVRELMIPVLKTFPSLTGMYESNCLINNPYFEATDMNCWPCSNTRSVLNLTGSDLNSKEYPTGIPFIYKDENMKHVNLFDLKRLYKNNKEVFDNQSPFVETINMKRFGSWSTVEELLLKYPPDIYPSKEKNIHAMWKLVRLESIRAVRNLFGNPTHSPSYTTGIAPERFVIVDEPQALPYTLPSTDGSIVFIVQASGSRLIVLDPSPLCQSECQRVSLLLEAQHILWYNWWYWRASSYPVQQSDEISITYFGSYY